MLREHLPLSQRIELFEVFTKQESCWIPAGRGTTVGNKKILRLEGRVASSLMLRITDSRGVPALEELSVFGEG